MHIQHNHMVCGEFHVFHYLDLDQNVNNNAYSTPLLHEDLDVNHKMEILGIGWYYNTFSHICLQHQHYPEHDNLCLFIFFYWVFPVFTWSIYPCLRCSFDRSFWKSLARLTSFFGMQECIRICESNDFDPVIWTLDINQYIYIAISMAIRPSTTSLLCLGAFITRSIVIEWHWDKTDIRYSFEAYLYCSVQPSVFYHIVLIVDVSTFSFFYISIKRLMCVVAVAESCLLSSDKKIWNTVCCGHGFLDSFISVCDNALKIFNALPSIGTDIFAP